MPVFWSACPPQVIPYDYTPSEISCSVVKPGNRKESTETSLVYTLTFE